MYENDEIDLLNPRFNYPDYYIFNDEDEVIHEGKKRRSGRWEWGSGERPYQHESWSWLRKYDEVREELGPNVSQTEIANALGLKNTQELRDKIKLANEEVRQAKIEQVHSMRDRDGSTVSEISKRTGIPETTVRKYLKADPKANNVVFKNGVKQVQNTMNVLKDEVDKKGYLDVGEGIAESMKLTQGTLSSALTQLKESGYHVHRIYLQRMTNKDRSLTYSVLTKNPDKDDVFKNHLYDIQRPGQVAEENGLDFKIRHIEPPKQLDWNKVHIRYADQGGVDKGDGFMEIRPGAEGLDLGNANLAQVRIAVGGTHFLKGMCAYGDPRSFPKGTDIIFNTNKFSNTPKEDVLKELKKSDFNPFGATIKENGQRGYLNIVSEEGDWAKWNSSSAPQFLAKQPVQYVKKRLKSSIESYRSELDSILAINQPAVKSLLLEQYALSCDTRARKLKAVSPADSAAKVLVPVSDMNPKEVYAPTYPNGTRVILVRYPHGGRFELPELIVNNNVSSAKKMFGQNTIDAVGIHPSVAQRLSGADFDGDTVHVFVNNSGDIKTAPALEGLKDFDPSKYTTDHETISKKGGYNMMGKITNLIADMTLKGASADELLRAVAHSMVMIDAHKHKYDYKQSEKDQRIAELRRKYYTRTDPETGKTKMEASTLLTRAKNHMDEVDDARKLMSDKQYPIEKAYANFANKIKDLQNEALKAKAEITKYKEDKSLGKKGGIYENEVNSINEKYRLFEENKPRERQAQLIASRQYTLLKNTVPDDKKSRNKLRAQLEMAARVKTGSASGKVQIKFTEKEWEAIEAGAISFTKLEKMLGAADMDRVRELATPKDIRIVTPAMESRIKQFAANGYTQAEIAKRLGISVTSINKALTGKLN